MAIEDGGAAFPVMPPLDVDGSSVSGFPYPEAGMSLRDWFAGQAIIGLMTCGNDVLWPKTPENVAHQSYRMADAVLAARSKPEAPTHE